MAEVTAARILLPAVVAACAALAPGSPLHAQNAPAVHVDSVFASFAAPGSPGCAVGAVANGQLVYARGYGSANLDYDVPLDGRSVFYLASVSKQFTAAAIVLAAQEGKLSLDDDVRKYIPEFPDYGTPITIRHLVHHTSGIRDYLTLIPLAGRRADDYWSDAALYGLVFRQKALNFTPGTEHLYSNTGYVLLAEIVRRATGQSLREYADAKIFQPLGMRDTHFHDDASIIVPRRVVGYTRGPDGAWRINHWFSFDKVGDGGLYSTVEDLAKWDGNFYSGRVGGEAFLRQMHERGRLANGDSLTYAFGLVHGSYRGLRGVQHGGSLTGFRTALVRFPEQRFTAIVLCNTPTANAAALATSVAEAYLAKDMSRPATPPIPVSSANQANTGNAPARAAPATADRSALRHYTGSFRSDELDAVYRITAEAEGLVVQRGDARLVLRAGPDGDTFLTANNATLRFARDAGRVVGFILDAGRVRGIRFDRIPDAR